MSFVCDSDALVVLERQHRDIISEVAPRCFSLERHTSIAVPQENGGVGSRSTYRCTFLGASGSYYLRPRKLDIHLNIMHDSAQVHRTDISYSSFLFHGCTFAMSTTRSILLSRI